MSSLIPAHRNASEEIRVPWSRQQRSSMAEEIKEKKMVFTTVGSVEFSSLMASAYEISFPHGEGTG